MLWLKINIHRILISFRLVIMDIHLSETDDVELLKMIRQIKPMPILVLSSGAESMKLIEGFVPEPMDIWKSLMNWKSVSLMLNS